MYKTWGEIRKETLALGFEKVKAYEKNKQSYIDAYNWAVNYLNNTISPVTDIIKLDIDYEATSGEYDLNRLTATEDKTPVFSGVYDVLNSDNRRINYRVKNRNILIIPSSYDGEEITVIYKKYVPKLTSADSDTFICPLEYRYTDLVPYLMANRLYLDDDRSKAGYYWNLFDDMKNRLQDAEMTRRVNVVIVNDDYTKGRWSEWER